MVSYQHKVNHEINLFMYRNKTKYPLLFIFSFRGRWLKHGTCFLHYTQGGLLPMKRQWTHGPTLLLWRSHLHTALRLFKNLSQMNFKLKWMKKKGPKGDGFMVRLWKGLGDQGNWGVLEKNHHRPEHKGQNTKGLSTTQRLDSWYSKLM